MTDAAVATGRCLCGSVSFTAPAASQTVAACHCGMCRQWGGGPYMAVACGTDVSFLGDDNISVYNSSDWAERGFCRQCGTHLFYRLKSHQLYFMPAGVFDGDRQFVFDTQIFVDTKPDYYCFANETTDMTEAEFIAANTP